MEPNASVELAQGTIRYYDSGGAGEQPIVFVHGLLGVNGRFQSPTANEQKCRKEDHKTPGSHPRFARFPHQSLPCRVNLVRACAGFLTALARWPSITRFRTGTGA